MGFHRAPVRSYRATCWRLSGLGGPFAAHGRTPGAGIDTVVVLAICSGLPTPPRRLVTIDVHTQFLAPVVGQDCIAEAVVRKRGRSIVFLRVEVRTDDGALVAEGALAYKVSVAADG